MSASAAQNNDATSADNQTQKTSQSNDPSERRFSAGSSGLFRGLQDYKRHPENERASERRESLKEQSVGSNGLGNLWNKIVKG